MILAILKQLANTTKRLEKESILKDNNNNMLLKKVFLSAYDPTITYWVAAHPVVQTYAGTHSLDTAIDELLDQVASRKITGHAAIEFYRSILTSLSEDDAQVLRLIVDRDLRCGVQTPTINKIWKNLIPTYDVMLAGKEPKHLRFPDVVVQPKFDGIRCLVTHKLDGDIEMRTRNGSLITSLEPMYDDFREAIGLGETWDGELVCYKDGLPLARKESNGITYKAIRGTIDEKEVEWVRFAPWDIVDKTQTLTYDKRLQALYLAVHRARHIAGIKKIIAIPTTKVENLKEIERLFNEALSRGEEGVIAKNLKGLWEPKRSKNLCKFKAEETADLVVVDWEEGTGKYAGQLGALVCETSDGKVRVNVGSGFSDEQRRYIIKAEALDKICEIKYNAVISKKDGGVDSLYLPRFIQFRLEKNIANSSAEIK